MAVLEVSENKEYGIIRQLNEELAPMMSAEGKAFRR